LKGEEVVPLAHADLEVCDHEAARRTLTDLRPALVINTSAFHQVDRCEDEPERTFAVNAFAVRNLAEVCRDLDCSLLHFSTDYVFGGPRDMPWREEDAPFPLSVYAASKLVGEYFLKTLCPRHYLVRTSGLYGVAGSSGKGGNFVETMLRLGRERGRVAVVTDQVLSPTYTVDLARALVQLAETGAYGLYHMTSSGSCSWNQFAQKIFALAGMAVEVAPITSKEYGSRAPRPAYSVLDNGKVQRLGVDALRPWEEALAAYLQERQETRRGV
jgi:dTDP-4-dehydrorhamnose reductase